MSSRLPPKSSAETVPVTFDFTGDLPSSVTLTGTPTVTASTARGSDPNPAAVLSGAPGFNAAKTQVIQAVLGGISGCEYLLTCVCATTQSNLVLSLVGILPIQSDIS